MSRGGPLFAVASLLAVHVAADGVSEDRCAASPAGSCRSLLQVQIQPGRLAEKTVNGGEGHEASSAQFAPGVVRTIEAASKGADGGGSATKTAHVQAAQLAVASERYAMESGQAHQKSSTQATAKVAVGDTRLPEGSAAQREKELWQSIGMTTAFVLIVVLFLVIVCLFTNLLGKMIKTSVMTIDRRFLGVDIELGTVAVSLRRGRIEIDGCQVMNPEGYKGPYLLHAGRILIDLNMGKLLRSLGKTVEVDVLEVTDIDCIVEYSGVLGGTSNFQKIMDHLSGDDKKPSEKKAERQEKLTAAGANPAPEKEGQALVVHKILFTNVGAKLATKIAGVRVAVGDMQFDDFSKQTGHLLVEDVVCEIAKTFSKTLLVNITGKGFMDKFEKKAAPDDTPTPPS